MWERGEDERSNAKCGSGWWRSEEPGGFVPKSHHFVATPPQSPGKIRRRKFGSRWKPQARGLCTLRGHCCTKGLNLTLGHSPAFQGDPGNTWMLPVGRGRKRSPGQHETPPPSRGSWEIGIVLHGEWESRGCQQGAGATPKSTWNP